MKLPTDSQELCVFFHHHKILGKTIRGSSRCAVRKVLQIWAMAVSRQQLNGMPLRSWNTCLADGRNLKEAEMVKNLKKLFGVADAMSIIIVAKDRFFIEDQREPQVGYM